MNPFTCVPNQTSYTGSLPLCLDNDSIHNPNNCTSVQIGGRVFVDLNTNCAYNLSDQALNHIPVRLLDTQNNLISMNYSVDGTFGLSSQTPDTFLVELPVSGMPYALACAQPNTRIVTLDSVSQNISGIHFPLECDVAENVFVQDVHTNGWVFPGQTHSLFTEVGNHQTLYNLSCDTNTYSGTVSIQVTGPVAFSGTIPNALNPSVNGNIFTFNISDFNLLDASSFGMLFITDTTAQSGDQICVQVQINVIPADANSADNTYNFCYQVVNSYDPNMKEVYPVNVLPGYDDWFTYTIHFQNTGTAPAFNIRLRDTLDAQLDLNTFEVRGFSHPANVNLTGDVLTVRFNNIMLPDSTSDYEGSMGYFQYRIKPLQNLPLGTQIENTAYIYFDFNAPIITNTTRNEFLLPTSFQEIPVNQKLLLFPNPGSGLFFFKDSRSVRSVEVFNMLGEKVLNLGAVNQINLEAQPKGMYMVRVNGTQMGRVVKE